MFRSSAPRPPLVGLSLVLCAVACQSAPADLREWRPSDHTNTGQSGAMKKGQVAADATPNPAGMDQVTLSTWQNNCTSCHGRIGMGDGPQSPLYQPRDLTDPAFQASVTDEQLLASIQQGKGKMPGFALPETTARGLVRLVRLLARKAPSAAPSGSAAAPTSSAEPGSSQAAPGASSPGRE